MSRFFALLSVSLLLYGCNDAPDEEPPVAIVSAEVSPGETVYTLDQDLTWTTDTVISGVWYVAAGVTLRIAAGVEVSFLPGTALVVDGILLLDGDIDAPVRFTNASTLSVGNFGVSVGGNGDLSQLRNVSFDGVSLYLEGQASAAISAAQFSNASLLVSDRAEAFSVVDCSFIDGRGELQDGIVATGVASLTVSGSTFSNLLNGILFDGSGSDPELLVLESTFNRVYSAITSGVAGVHHRVELDTVSITDTSSNALDFSNATAVVQDTTITRANYNGIYTDRLSSLVLSDSSVTATVMSCVGVLGRLDADGVSVSDCGSAGLWGGIGGCVVRDSAVSNTESFGIRCQDALQVEDTTIQDTGRSALWVMGGNAIVAGVTISSVRGAGVQVYDGDVHLSGSVLSDIDESGVLVQYGSVTVTDTSITDARTYGIRSVVGDISVLAGGAGVSISNIGVHGLVAVSGNISATSLSVLNTGAQGVACSGGDLSLTNTTISTTGSHAVSVSGGDAQLLATDGPVEVLFSGAVGVAVSGGNLNADGLVVRNSFSTGIDVANGQALLSSCVVENAGSHGIAGRQSPLLSVSNCTVIGSYNNGISLSSGGTLVVADTTIDAPGLTGIHGYRAAVQVTNSSVASSGQNGIYVHDGSLSVIDTVISNVTTYGIYSSVSDATIDNVQVVDLSPLGDQASAGAMGISVTAAAAIISNTVIDKAQSYGISMVEGSISASTISNGAYTGVYLSGHAASVISGSNITDNLFRGIQTVNIGDNLTDVIGNNITGNGDLAVAYAQSVSGNYIADNKDQSGADVTLGGTVDGIRDTSGPQIYGADAIDTPASTPLSGTGPLAL